ncbi:HEPN domain-containing protein [Candidatus Omnitrophota bacterium]
MKKKKYNYRQKRRASTLLALGLSEYEAAEVLIKNNLFREAVVHIYFCSFYLTQALLCDKLPTNPSHKNVERVLHRAYGRSKYFPRRYVEFHSYVHNLRNTHNYKSFHVPSPRMVKRKINVLKNYVDFCLKVVPRIEIWEILEDFSKNNADKIKDFSFDIYCPKTYAHHTRLTFWCPPFYLNIFTARQLAKHSKIMLKGLKVNKYRNYVLGINSRINQYSPLHLIMVDIDSVNFEIESAFKKIGGILIKTGRGFHFIGDNLVYGQENWEKEMKKLQHDRVLKKYIDQEHIEISLRRQYATLRITESPAKPTLPFFYKQL